MSNLGTRWSRWKVKKFKKFLIQIPWKLNSLCTKCVKNLIIMCQSSVLRVTRLLQAYVGLFLVLLHTFWIIMSLKVQHLDISYATGIMVQDQGCSHFPDSESWLHIPGEVPTIWAGMCSQKCFPDSIQSQSHQTLPGEPPVRYRGAVCQLSAVSCKVLCFGEFVYTLRKESYQWVLSSAFCTL